jgi:hypothetical protein
MFKERSTENLIKYIQTLPGEEQRLIVQRISKGENIAKKKKSAAPRKIKLSALKGKLGKTTPPKIDRQIKSLRSSWQRPI